MTDPPTLDQPSWFAANIYSADRSGLPDQFEDLCAILANFGYEVLPRWSAHALVRPSSDYAIETLQADGWKLDDSGSFVTLSVEAKTATCSASSAARSLSTDGLLSGSLTVEFCTSKRSTELNTIHGSVYLPNDRPDGLQTSMLLTGRADTLHDLEKHERCNLFRDVFTSSAKHSRCCGFVDLGLSDAIAGPQGYDYLSTAFPVSWKHYVNRVLWRRPDWNGLVPRGLYWGNLFYLPDGCGYSAPDLQSRFRSEVTESHGGISSCAEAVGSSHLYIALSNDPLDASTSLLPFAAPAMNEPIEWVAKLMKELWPNALWVC